SVLVGLLDLRHALLVVAEDLLLLRGNDDVVLRDRDAGLRSVVEAEILDRVEDDGDGMRAVLVDERADEVAELLLRERPVEEVVVRRVVAVELPDRLAERAVDLRVEDHAAGRGKDELALPQVLDRLLERDLLRVEGELDVLLGAEPLRARIEVVDRELLEVQVGVREV